MNIVRFALAMATMATLGLASTVGFGAAPPSKATSPAPMTPKDPPSTLTLGSPVLLTTTYSASTFGTVAVGPGFRPIDKVKTVVCPPKNGACRIEADQSAQVTGGPGGNNRWAVCTQVDGVFMDRPSCPFLGLIDPSFFQTGAFSQQKIAILPGNHTVRTYIYTDSGASLGNYSIQYRVYQ